MNDLNGIVDVGGGMRDIYGAGVFDRLLDDGIDFPYVTGVSAGSANAVTYLAKQRGRNFLCYMEYSFRRDYMSFHNFIKKGSYVDLEYVYNTLSDSKAENPLDYAAMAAGGAQLNIIAANALTGEAAVFHTEDMNADDFAPLMASSCLPFVSKPVFIDGVPYFDGGMAEPVPIERAFNDGCEKAVLILTKPRDTVRTPSVDGKISRLLERRFPAAADGLYKRHIRYNEAVEKAKQLEKEGRVLILAPDSCCGVDTLKRTKESLYALYKKGYEDAACVKDFLNK